MFGPAPNNVSPTCAMYMYIFTFSRVILNIILSPLERLYYWVANDCDRNFQWWQLVVAPWCIFVHLRSTVLSSSSSSSFILMVSNHIFQLQRREFANGRCENNESALQQRSNYISCWSKLVPMTQPSLKLPLVQCIATSIAAQARITDDIAEYFPVILLLNWESATARAPVEQVGNIVLMFFFATSQLWLEDQHLWQCL